ncbi:hypothetical protein N7508_005947 [Penicillium antarcticum]|uniref:uncharacterized protein n=1 Tax=Penicillium antarcticum TaxID=416450 RepID=UPI002397F307|nr:uncharacterized protein N7508_005947 [Penicillium antarcticum]KAJ5306932.1 hypothetical protein N7508_005947 [Penicillium antarcticum]
MVDSRQWWLHFLLAGLIWSVATRADINCYNPDGSQAPDDVPCTSDSTTFCCSKGDVCMSNGLCYLQGKRGFVLSRASCTDRSWNSCGSYTYCMPYNKGSGFPIVSAQYNGSSTIHCCGTANWEDGTVNCGNFKSVEVPHGTAIAGVAGLSAASSVTATSSPGSSTSAPTSTSNPTSDSGSNAKREAAIGAGVGVPLGVIALASIAWALWERRARVKALSQPISAPAPMNQPFFHQPGTPRPPVELGASDVSELGNGETPKPPGSTRT